MGVGGEGRQQPWYFLNPIFSDFRPLTSAFDLAVALKARLALADVLGGQVAAFGVLHTFPGQLGDLALVNIWDKEKLGCILVMVFILCSQRCLFQVVHCTERILILSQIYCLPLIQDKCSVLTVANVYVTLS